MCANKWEVFVCWSEDNVGVSKYVGGPLSDQDNPINFASAKIQDTPLNRTHLLLYKCFTHTHPMLD